MSALIIRQIIDKAVIRGAYWEHENPSADRYTLFKRLNDPLFDNCTLQKIDEN